MHFFQSHYCSCCQWEGWCVLSTEHFMDFLCHQCVTAAFNQKGTTQQRNCYRSSNMDRCLVASNLGLHAPALLCISWCVDLTSIISVLLQECMEDKCESVAALGLQAIALLCEDDVLEFYAAWRVVHKALPKIPQQVCMLTPITSLSA